MSGNRGEEDWIDIVLAPSLHEDLSISSLAALTERMLQPDKRVDEIKAVLQSDADLNFQQMVSAGLARSRTW